MVDPDRLKKGEIFKDLSYEELGKVAAICTLEEFKKGDVVILSEEPAERFYLLEGGSVELIFPNGKTVIMKEPGALAGWSSLVSPYRYVGSMKCLEDCRFLAFPSQDFLEIITAEASIGIKVMQQISSVIANRLRLVSKGDNE
jgi:CRP-like cAMP-binding protein